MVIAAVSHSVRTPGVWSATSLGTVGRRISRELAIRHARNFEFWPPSCSGTLQFDCAGHKERNMYQISRTAAAFTMLLALAACSNPYDPGQRALGGAAIGAGAGAAIGGLAGGWQGAGIGALAGGAVGAVTGAVTTPRPPPPAYYSPPRSYAPPQY